MADRRNTLDAWDRDHFFHPMTNARQHARGETPNRIIVGGEGVFIFDREGRRSLDAFAGLYCVNVGYGRQEIADAIAKQAKELTYYHSYLGHGTEVSITLAKMIIDRAPKGMSRIYFGLGGSDANETALKLVWYINNVLKRPQKKKIISRWRGYHGSGLMSGSLTGLEVFHKAFDLPKAPILHTTAPYFYRRQDTKLDEESFSKFCAEQLEEMIVREGPDTVAAFIAEPMLGSGGIVPPPKGYWQKIQPILKKYDILLIADEVITGFGRLGTMFGSDLYGLQPDLMTIAKGVTSAYAPLSGTIVSEKMWRVLEQGGDMFGPIGHGWTYSAHPLCAAAGVANLELIDRLDLIENTKKVGSYFRKALAREVEKFPIVGEVRGEGLLAAIELVEDKDDRKFFDPGLKVGPRVVAAMLQRGVIARAMAQGDIVGFAPPLCLAESEADQIVEVTKSAIESVGTELELKRDVAR